MSTFPNLFIVGAPRCGTTAMYDYLNAHPQIAMSSYKEPHYFGSDLVGLQFEIFRGNEKKYLDLFPKVAGTAYQGEASVYYLYSRHAAREIHQFNPDARILIMLRSPLEVLKSLYVHIGLAGDLSYNSIDEAVALAAKLENDLNAPTRQRFLSGSGVQFYEQVRRFFDTFGRENVHVIIYDDFRNNPAASYRATLEFLGVDPDFAPEFRIVNASQQSRSKLVTRILGTPLLIKAGSRLPKLALPLYRMLKVLNARPLEKSPASEFSPATHQYLQNRLQPDLDQLGNLLGRDFSSWLSAT